MTPVIKRQFQSGLAFVPIIQLSPGFDGFMQLKKIEKDMRLSRAGITDHLHHLSKVIEQEICPI